MNNTLRTTILLAALTALIVWVGQMLGGSQGAVIAFMFAAVMNIGSYWFSDRIVIAMYRGQPLREEDDPELFQMVRELAIQNHIPMPRLYLIPTESPNAFATGRNPEHAAVAVTAGIRRLLDRRELKAVLAHELAHVTNRDILISSIAATLAGAIMMLANMARWSLIFGGGNRDERDSGGGLGLLVSIIVAPIAAMLIQMAISRSREYQADETGARISHDPEALASALQKIAADSERIPLAASPATAHMFIVNPLRGMTFQNLFSTHPPLEQRIARLQQIATDMASLQDAAGKRMAERDEEQPVRSFKVADRRRFVDTESSDAAERQDEHDRRVDTERERESERVSATTQREQPAGAGDVDAAFRASAASEPSGHAAHGMPVEMTFSTFVIGLTTQALMHLGEIADPLQQETGRDLPAAKQMIDLLGILREKTKGNLDQAEEQLLDSMLYDLRMRYVEASRSR